MLSFYFREAPNQALYRTGLRSRRTRPSLCGPHNKHVPRAVSTTATSEGRAGNGKAYTELHLARNPLKPVAWDQFSATESQPVLFEAYRDVRDVSSQATQLLSALSKGKDRIVEVELGRYDDTRPDAFHQVSMRLGQYIDWLQSDRTTGYVGGKQVYLAQWIGHGEVCCLVLCRMHSRFTHTDIAISD